MSFFLLFPSIFFSIFILLHLFNKFKDRKLPPGPPSYPIIGNLIWLRRSILDLEPVLHELVQKYGPIVTLRIGSRLAIFIADPKLTHKALIGQGTIFSNRPTPLPANRFLSCNQHNVSSAAYGPLWRLLRRNLISEILNPSRIKIYANGRTWVLSVLINHLHVQSQCGPVVASQSFQFAMFCLLVLMCYGEKLDEKAIREIEDAHRTLLLYSGNLNVLAFFPWISKYVFKSRMDTAVEMLKRQTDVVLPLIKARRLHKKSKNEETEERYVYSYLDSLLDVKLPEEGGRMLTEEEVVALCAEFLNAGTDTTSTGLEWIMAELVIHQDIQNKLVEEIKRVGGGRQIEEEDLPKMPYLKAIVLEGLRRHPPANFVLPHAMSAEVEFEGYVIPKNATLNFMVQEMQRDERLWEDPMAFKPERFLDEDGGLQRIDITGSKEIKMMPFGVGRRICPGLGLAVLHLEYFVANLVREFEWKGVDGEKVDLSEKTAFTMVMKNPLKASLVPRKM